MIEHLNELGRAVIAIFDWSSSHIVAVQRLPGFWLVLMFCAGLAAGTWLVPIARKRIKEGPLIGGGPIVNTWLTPLQAAEKFVDPELLSRDLAAHESAKKLGEKVKLLETEITGTVEPEKIAALQEQLTNVIRERDDADYLARRRRSDVVESLRVHLRERLVAKGCKVTKNNEKYIKGKEQYIPEFFWFITLMDTDILDLDTGRAWGGIGGVDVYRDVLIGENEKKT